jgi:tRNA-modifying protein YgfZ
MNISKFALLNDLKVIRVLGDDAKTFLQNLLTSDIQKTNLEVGTLSGFCSPKGRLQASFWVTTPTPSEFLLWISSDISLEFSKKLSMYKLRSKVEIQLLDDTWKIFGKIHDHELEHSPQMNFICKLPSVNYLDVQYQRTLIASNQLPLDELSVDNGMNWKLLEAISGIPRITNATKDLFVPQMVNFESVGGVDFKKGCYPGQEIVARSQYLGTIKRRLMIGFVIANVDLDQEVLPGTIIYSSNDPDQEVGVIVLSAFNENKQGYFLQIEVMLNFVNKDLMIRSDSLGLLQISEISNPPYPLLEI